MESGEQPHPKIHQTKECQICFSGKKTNKPHTKKHFKSLHYFILIQTLLSFMLLLGFKINFILVPSKTPEQNVVMHIIIKQLYSFINMTVIQTEYNSVSYQIKWYQLTAQSKFVHYFRVLWQTTF